MLKLFLILYVSIENVFETSCDEVLKAQPEKLKKGLPLKFNGEEGMVSGSACTDPEGVGGGGTGGPPPPPEKSQKYRVS